MLCTSRFIRWLSMAGVAATMGCSLAPKTDQGLTAKGLNANRGARSSLFNFGRNPTPPDSSVSTKTGSGEFSTSNKLKDPVKVHLAYARWHEQDGNMIEARNSYNTVLEKSSKNVDAMLGLARLDIAISRLDDAEGRIKKAQKIAPKNPQVAVTYGQYYSARKDWPRALEQMKLARELSPYEPAYAYHVGYVQAKSGDLDSALTSFTEAVGPAEAQYNLGFILFEEGRIAAAEEHLQKAISIKPELAQAQSLLLNLRQKHYGTKTELVQQPGLGQPNEFGSGILPISHTEYARQAR